MTSVDRDLLLGLLALQNGIIDQGRLVAAFQAWTLDKSRSLADHLESRGDLSVAKRRLLEALAEVHLEAHGGDPDRSLAAVTAGDSTRERLAGLGDPDLEATLERVGSGTGSTEDDDADRTSSYVFGAATSDGQRFRVLRPHARGGLGAVFVALDGELNREVALKQILDDYADDPMSRQRFLVEAEITGGLVHPGIVPVYGLGTYDGGRPYYAMRFVKGDSLKEAIHRFHVDDVTKRDPGSRSLELRKLLRRFTDVCNAIEYAHARGVLHRDIKPGNVIVGKHGETLVVDWGLAKALGTTDARSVDGERALVPASTSGSAETLPGSALGTPSYMSPEQAAGELDRLGPRSDVYSLGATLYCLLTGKAPFEGDLGEILNKVRRGEFARPRQLEPSIDPALEAICLKAMATRLEDRYSSCRALAEDLDRWTADEPVTAWREPFGRRARRWAKRNRTAVTGAAVALVAGVVGLSAVLAVQSKAKADIALSLANETRANVALAEANADLTASKAAVQARYDLAVDAIKTFHTGVSEDFLLKQDQFKELRDRLLRSASDFYGKLAALLGKESDLASRRALAQANFEVAALTAKVGRTEDALAAHRDVLARREALASDPSADAETKADVGRSLTAVASLLETTGKSAEADATYLQAEALLSDLAASPLEPPASRAALATCRAARGNLLLKTGKADEALTVLRMAQADQATAAAAQATNGARSDLAATIIDLGILLSETGKPAEAEAEYRKAIAILQKLADDNPALPGFRADLGNSHNNLGLLLSETGKPAEAEAEHREASRLRQKLADENPAVTRFRNDLAASHNNLGILLSETGKPAEAEAECLKALSLFQKLADENPAVTRFRNDLASSHNNLGVLLSDAGKPAEAEAEYRKAIAIMQKLADDNPDVTRFRVVVAGSHVNLGILLSLIGKPAEAEAEYRETIAIMQKLADDNPALPGFRADLGNSHNGLGVVLFDTGKPAEAEAEYREAIAIMQKLADDNPAVTDFRLGLANSYHNIAEVLRRAARRKEALEACERARALLEPLVLDHPELTECRSGLAVTWLRTGQVHFDEGDLAGASDAWIHAVAIFDALKSPTDESAFQRACCHACLAGLAARPGSGVSAEEGRAESDLAVGWVRQAVESGIRNPGTYSSESALDSLRGRADFRLLMMDLAMPIEPFAQGD